MKTAAAILILTFLGSASRAQKALDTLSFQHIKTGMSQSSATQIFEDSEGFLWVGTPNGLNKFDGTTFQAFEKSDDEGVGLTDGYVESIYEDKDGMLYIGTNQGLNLYNRKFNRVKPYTFKPKGQFLQTKYISAISRSGDYLWLGTDNSGLYRYNIQTGETKQIIFDEIDKGGPSNHFIVALFPLEEDKLLMITQVSIYIINDDLQVVSQIEKPQDLSSALRSSETKYYLGSHDGQLITLDIRPDYTLFINTLPIFPGYSILSLEEDDQGTIWLGSENAGLSLYSPDSGIVSNIQADVRHPNSITSNSIWSIHKSRNGVMWLGPFKNGLSFYDPEYYKFLHYKADPFDTGAINNNLVNSFLAADKGNIWVGTDGGGLSYWNRTTDSFEAYSLDNGKLNTNVVLSLFKDDKDQLWIGSWANGLAILNLETMEYTTWNRENSFLGSNNVTDMLQDSEGRIWIVTLFGGVHVYYPESGEHKHVSVRSEKDGSEAITVARLLEDSNGQIWVGSQTSGLFRLEEQNDKWIPLHYHALHEKRPISNDFINTMVQDQSGTLWVGTQAGLNQYQPESDTFITITKKDGLVNDAIKGIIRDEEGYLWLSTGKGIVQYDPAGHTFVNYDEDDGLQGNEFNAAAFYKTQSGELLFGGSNGFNIFTPAAVKKRQDVPKVFISNLQLFNQSVVPNDGSGILHRDISQTDTLVLSYDQDVVNFEFHTLTYRHPERVNFAYFLEGFEEEWNYVGNDPHATYTNLSPGSYTLRIKSTNSDGVWVDNETKLFLSITPPYWKTWWFITIIVIASILLVYLLYSLRIRNLKRYQFRLEQQIDQRTSELQLKQKKLMNAADKLSERNEEIQRFAFAVSHDLKSPLNSIKGIASLIPMEIDIKSYPEMEEYVTYIDETCDTMNSLINDITKIARLGKIENKMELLNTNEIIAMAGNLVQGRLTASHTKLYISKNLPQIVGDKNRILQVFENLLDNGIKYMGNQEDPVIRVEARRHETRNQFLVIDNGSGMDPESLEKLFTPFERFDGSVEGSGLGLYMVKKIIESHKGEITATSEGKGKGTTFIVSLPLIENSSTAPKVNSVKNS
ncbi:MAG: two-component regulator propeller domain-containing protein [Bacteroidota bacterium]